MLMNTAAIFEPNHKPTPENEYMRNITTANPPRPLYGDGGDHHQCKQQSTVPLLLLRAGTRQGRLLVHYRRPPRERVLLPLPLRLLCLGANQRHPGQGKEEPLPITVNCVEKERRRLQACKNSTRGRRKEAVARLLFGLVIVLVCLASAAFIVGFFYLAVMIFAGL